MFEILLIFFSVFIIVAAIIAINVHNLFTAVMSLSATGFGLAIIFLLLKAPEAVTSQLIVEIFTFTMLLVTLFKTEGKDSTKEFQLRRISPATAMFFFIFMFMLFSIPALKSLNKFGNPVMKVSNEYIKKMFTDISAGNISTGILLDFRAYNTLIEAIILIVMVIGVIVILRKTGRKSTHG